MKQKPNHSDRGHAEFSPSSLKYVAKCAGYHGKDGSNAAAEMGTRIHEALEVNDPSALHNEEELAIYEKIQEMEAEFLSNFSGISEEHNEIQVDVALNGTATWGTCDRFLILKNGDAIMADYKTGISIIDPPQNNWQAKAYVVGAFQKFPEVEQITFVFYVPQHNQSLHHTFNRASDYDSLIEELSAVVLKAEATRPKWSCGQMDLDDLNPSVNCRFCRHEEHCPALGAVAVEVVQKYKPELLPAPPINSSDVEDPATLEKLYIIARIVESWASGIKRKAMELALEGHEFQDLKLKSMGSLKKTVDKNYLAQLAVRYGLDLTEVIEAADLTMNQISKVLHDKTPKGKKSFVVDSFEKEAIDLGVVEVGPTRYTLSSR